VRLLRRLLVAAVAAAIALAVYVVAGMPARGTVRALATSNPGTTGVMRQREAEAKKAGRPPRHVQSWVPLSGISRHLVHAVLSSEDQKFFGHQGVDWDAIEKSAQEDRKQWRLARGGSTITQQLAKNLYFTTHKSPVRKVRELFVARWLEEDLTKRRILELYLNVIEWGDGVYGAQAAAQRYYGKPASALDVDEAAGLAGMIPNPRKINPRVDARRFARAQRRVLWLMAHAGYLSRSGLGAEPPPEEPEDDDELPAAEADAPAAAPAATPTPSSDADPGAAPSAAPAEAPSPAPEEAPSAPAAPDPTPSPV
jgi:monofunctional biosynthetic peptidoglycan transglycosylase